MKIEVKNLDEVKPKRENVDDYFLKITELVGERGTCAGKFTFKGMNGCILVREKNILSTGYVGSPSGMPHCLEVGHELNEQGSCIRTSHAEINCIVNAAKNGVAVNEATAYVTTFPCYTCSKALINAGVKRIVALHDYHKSKESKAMFDYLKISYKIKNI